MELFYPPIECQRDSTVYCFSVKCRSFCFYLKHGCVILQTFIPHDFFFWHFSLFCSWSLLKEFETQVKELESQIRLMESILYHCHCNKQTSEWKNNYYLLLCVFCLNALPSYFTEMFTRHKAFLNLPIYNYHWIF